MTRVLERLPPGLTITRFLEELSKMGDQEAWRLIMVYSRDLEEGQAQAYHALVFQLAAVILVMPTHVRHKAEIEEWLLGDRLDWERSEKRYGILARAFMDLRRLGSLYDRHELATWFANHVNERHGRGRVETVDLVGVACSSEVDLEDPAQWLAHVS